MQNMNETAANNTENFLGPNVYEIHRRAAPELLILERTITPIWYIIGIIGNPLSIKIWLSAKVRKTNSSAIYLGAIAVVHTIFILLHVLNELLLAWAVRTYNRPPVFCELFMVVFLTPQYLAPILILGFTFERFLAICFPFMKESVCTVKKAMIAVAITTVFALIFGCFQAFFWQYRDNTGVCELRLDRVEFYSVWTWFSEMLVFAAVPLTVLVLNILVIVEINRINKFGNSFGQDSRSSNQTSTVTLLSVSFYLICTLLPATIVYAIQMKIPEGNTSTPPEEWKNDSSWTSYLTYYHIRKIVEEICLSNYACYVFIYCITSSYFRKEAKKNLGIFICCKNKKNTCSNGNTYSTYVTDGKSRERASESFL